MIPAPRTQYEHLSNAEGARVDAACDRFERAWKEVETGGAHPAIRPYCTGFEEPERTVLVWELIALDRDYRTARGEMPRPEDYRGLCPEYDEQLPPDSTQPHGAATHREPPGPWPELPGLRIVEVLGAGGMGVVYKAWQPGLDRYVAVKMLLGTGWTDAAQRERFNREARAAAQLQHPNLVQVYAVGEAESASGTPLPYFVLEYVSGGSLARHLAGAPQPPRKAAQLVATLARAVSHVHAQGIVHRDLKPANILLARADSGIGKAEPGTSEEGTVAAASPASALRLPSGFLPKITDFGLAKLGAGSELTRTGDALGTPSYMAPEQTGDTPEVVGPACDVYGLGAILYECLTGRPPFRAETPLATVIQVRLEEPVPPRRLQPTVPRDLETICLKCLRKEPRHRYRSADALADDIQRYLDGKPIRARPLGALGHVVKWARRRPTAAALLSVIGLATAALLAVLVDNDVRLRQEQRATVKALRDETEARNALTQTLDRERYRLYLQRVRLAQAAILGSNVIQAERDLDACLPEPGQKDLRGWEWHYLKPLCHAELLIFRAHGDLLSSVAFSADGQRVASIGQDLTLKVWDAVNGQIFFSIAVPTIRTKCCFSPDGKLLATGDPMRNLVVISDAKDGRELRTLSGIDPIFSPDGQRLAAIDASGKQVRIYNPASGAELRNCHFPGDRQRSFTFRADGLWAAATRPNRTIRVWNVETGEPGFDLRSPASDFVLVFSPDGSRIGAADNDGTIKIWDAARGEELVTINAHPTGRISSLAFSADGQRFASGDLGGALKVWDIKGQLIQTLPGHGAKVRGLAFGPGGRLLASASSDRTVKIWDANKDPNAVVLRGHSGFVLGLGFSPDGQRLVSAGDDGIVKVWDPATGRVLLDLPGGMGSLRHVRFSPDGKGLTACDEKTSVKTWDAATGKEQSSFPARKGSLEGTVSPCGRYVAAEVREDQTVKIWDLTTGQLLRSLHGHKGRILRLAFSPDSQQLASGGVDNTVRVWEMATGREVHTLRGHTQPVDCVAFSADGTRIASGGNDVIRLWDAQTGAEVLAIRPSWGRNSIFALAFSPDGKRLASGSMQALVTLWDTETGQEVLELPTARMIVTTVLFSPDGRRLAAVTNDGAVTVWHAPAADGAEDRKPDQ